MGLDLSFPTCDAVDTEYANMRLRMHTGWGWLKHGWVDSIPLFAKLCYILISFNQTMFQTTSPTL